MLRRDHQREPAEADLLAKFFGCLKIGLNTPRESAEHLAGVVRRLDRSQDAPRDIADAFPPEARRQDP